MTKTRLHKPMLAEWTSESLPLLRLERKDGQESVCLVSRCAFAGDEELHIGVACGLYVDNGVCLAAALTFKSMQTA